MKHISEAIRKPEAWFILYLALWLIINLVTLTWFPGWDCNGDEALHASCAWGIWKYGAVRSDMLSGSYLSQYGYGMLSGWIYYGILAVFLKIFGVHIFWARMVSLLSGCVALVFVYLAGKEIRDGWTGLVATVVLGGIPIFVEVSHFTRTDAMLAASVAVSVFLMLASVNRNRVWIAFLAGLVSVISFLVRPLGLFMVPAFLVVFLLWRRWRLASWFLAGCGAGCLILFFTNYLPYRNCPVLEDVDVANRNSPFLLVAGGKLGPAMSVLKANLLYWIGLFFGGTWRGHILLNLSLMGTAVGIFLNRQKMAALVYALALTLVLSAALLWPEIKYFYMPALAVIMGLGCALALARWRWASITLAILGLLYGAWQFSKYIRSDRNEPLFEINDRFVREISPGTTILGSRPYFWWGAHEKGARLVYPTDTAFVHKHKWLGDLVREYDADYVVILFLDGSAHPMGSPLTAIIENGGLIWRYCEENDLEFLLSCPSHKRLMGERRISSLGLEVDSIALYEVKK